MYVPKYLASLVHGISTPFASRLLHPALYLFPILRSIYLFWFILRSSRVSSLQHTFIIVCISITEGVSIIKSSAYIGELADNPRNLQPNSPNFRSMSSTYIENRVGDKTLPCLTPDSNLKGEDNASPQRTILLHILYQYCNNLIRKDGILRCMSLSNSTEWLTLSNAFATSIKQMLTVESFKTIVDNFIQGIYCGSTTDFSFKAKLVARRSKIVWEHY